jgi:acyl-CoA synthetase (AMP-forming)/AMP-acid ligase II
MDMETIESLQIALEKYPGTLIFVSHDREFVSSLATRVIELKPGAEASAAELIDLARDRLGGVKAPKSVDFTASLPRSPVGKVLKKDLRATYWAGHVRKI